MNLRNSNSFNLLILSFNPSIPNDRNIRFGFLRFENSSGFPLLIFKPFIKKTERSDIHKYSIFNLQFSIPAGPG